MIATILKLITFYLKFSRPLLVFAVLVSLLVGSTSVVLVGLISTRISNPETPAQVYLGAFIALSLAQLTLNVVSGFLMTHLAERTGFDLRLRLSRQILATPLRQQEVLGSHKLLAILTRDIPNITGASLQIPQTCISVTVLLGCLIYLGLLSSTMLVALIVCLVLAIVIVKVLEIRAKSFMKKARDDWDLLVQHFHALTEGAKELKINRPRRETFLAQVLDAAAASFRRNNVMIGSIYSVINGWSMALYFIIIGLILFIMPGIDKAAGRESLIGYAITVLYMRSYIIALMAILPYFADGATSLRKLEELGLSLSPVDFGSEAVGEGVDGSSWKHLELDGVTHSYYREREDDDFVLGPINLSLSAGELIFIIGGNGSGKTTLAKLLTGLYIPESGEIRLDGEPITDENRDYYRQYFSAVFTDFYLFEQLFGMESADVDERARGYISELQLTHKVKVEDGKFSTLDLSHGQRKRLALLTAYLEDRPIYVFDEWESGQDVLFREIFYLHLLPELKARGKTVFVISHDDRYYRVADRVVKLDYGKLEYDKPVSDALEMSLSLNSKNFASEPMK
jgi:putative ATP-binding cassette transporter